MLLISGKAQTSTHLSDSLSKGEFTAYLQQLVNDTLKPAKDFNAKLNPEYCKADLKILKRVLEEVQTSIYRYTSKSKIDSAFNNAFVNCNFMTYLELLRSITRIQNLIACGHSRWRHSADYMEYRKLNVKIFPFDLKIYNGRYYLLHNNSIENNIELLSEITHINGKPVDQITAQLRKHTYRDGRCSNEDLIDIEKYFSMAYSNFIDNPEEFKIRVVTNNSEEKEYHIRALLKAEIDSIRAQRYPPEEKMGIPLRFRMIDSINTGVYTIKWFRKDYTKNHGQDFEKFTDSVFACLADHKVKNLIIDIRNNTGGWTAYGKYLFSYFIDGETPYMQKVETQK